MKYLGVVGILSAALAIAGAGVSVSAQAAAQTAPAAGTALGSVNIPTRVMANGQVLTPGTYQVRITSDTPQPGPGQSPEGERWVEFLRNGKPVGREVATIVSAAEIAQVADGPRPAAGGSRVEMLKGNDYLRVWINRGGVNYLIHLPPAA